MKKYYDHKHNRLIYLGQSSDPQYWDNHWKKANSVEAIKSKKNRLIVNLTRKYLPENSRIIDGGCGSGDKVYALQKHGFDAYGVDFAKKTVQFINTGLPDLKVSLGDIRKLNFPDHFFDGYWSLGVIEHFFDGFEDIIHEIYRVLRPGGFLFLTVPEMSKYRKYLSRKGRYVDCSDSDINTNIFYQFAYAPEYIKQIISKNGFELKKYKPMDGVKGFKDESKHFQSIFQWIYDHPSLPVKVIKRLLDIIMSPLTGHSGLYIFYKSKH